MKELVGDTDVVSFLFKNHPIAARYDPEIAGQIPLISFMTIAELERWAVQYRWSEHRLRWLRIYLSRFTVVPSSPDLCRKWAEVMVAGQAAGRRLDAPTHGLPQPPCSTERRCLRTTATTIWAFPDLW